MDWCRLCSGSINKTNISVSLNDEIDLNVTFKDMIEYYCRIKLDVKSSLSEKVCFVCKSLIEKFIKFCDMTENVQLKLKDVKNEISFQEICINRNQEDSETDEDSQHFFEEIIKEEPVLSCVTKKKRKRGRVNNVYFSNTTENLII